MAAETETKPTRMERNGLTIETLCFTHEDGTQAWEVRISETDNHRHYACIPTWECENGEGARRYANAAYAAAAALATTAHRPICDGWTRKHGQLTRCEGCAASIPSPLQVRTMATGR